MPKYLRLILVFFIPLLLTLSVAMSAWTAAAPVWKATRTATTSSASTSLSVSLPNGVTEGDFMLAQITFLKGSDITVTAPEGWILVKTDNRNSDIGSSIYRKFAGTGEMGPYQWRFSQAVSANGGIIAYTGVDITNPIIESRGATGDSGNPVAPGVTTEDNSKLVAFFSIKQNTSMRTPTDMTERYLLRPRHDERNSKAADQDMMAGATGPRTSTVRSSDKWVAQLVAFRAAGESNTAPVAVNDNYDAVEDIFLSVPAPGVLANDTDSETNPLVAIMVTSPTSGTVTLNSDGSFTYTPDAGYVGTDSFAYKANDGTADSNEANVSININNTPTITPTPSITPTPTVTPTPTITPTPTVAPAPPALPSGGGNVGGGGGGVSSNRINLSQHMAGSPGVFTSEAFLKSWDGLLRFNISKGTIGKTAEGWDLSYVVLQPVAQAEQKLDPPQNGTIIGLTYKLEPEGATFSPLITITMLYEDSQVFLGIDEKDLVIGYWDTKSEQWEGIEDCIVDVNNNQITAPFSHFSIYAILYIPPKVTPASFIVGSLNISPIEASVGQRVYVSTTVTNRGGSADIYSLYLKINGVQTESREVNLAAGANQKMQFSIKTDTAGQYTADINGQTGQFVVKEPEGKIAGVPSETDPISTLISKSNPGLLSTPTPSSNRVVAQSPSPSSVRSSSPINRSIIITIIVPIALILLIFSPLIIKRNIRQK
jgi:hypothetical protein